MKKSFCFEAGFFNGETNRFLLVLVQGQRFQFLIISATIGRYNLEASKYYFLRGLMELTTEFKRGKEP